MVGRARAAHRRRARTRLAQLSDDWRALRGWWPATGSRRRRWRDRRMRRRPRRGLARHEAHPHDKARRRVRRQLPPARRRRRRVTAHQPRRRVTRGDDARPPGRGVHYRIAGVAARGRDPRAHRADDRREQRPAKSGYGNPAAHHRGSCSSRTVSFRRRCAGPCASVHSGRGATPRARARAPGRLGQPRATTETAPPRSRESEPPSSRRPGT